MDLPLVNSVSASSPVYALCTITGWLSGFHPKVKFHLIASGSLELCCEGFEAICGFRSRYCDGVMVAAGGTGERVIALAS